jgi:hypothetical protein
MTGAFPVRDYMITPTHIRTSKELTDLYRRIYVKNEGDKYKGFVDLNKFKFDFDYEIYNGPNEPTYILDDDGSNIPSYLSALE